MSAHKKEEKAGKAGKKDEEADAEVLRGESRWLLGGRYRKFQGRGQG